MASGLVLLLRCLDHAAQDGRTHALIFQVNQRFAGGVEIGVVDLNDFEKRLVIEMVLHHHHDVGVSQNFLFFLSVLGTSRSSEKNSTSESEK